MINLNWKERIKYGLYKRLSYILEFGIQVERLENFSRSARLDTSVKLLPNALVENLAGDRQLITVGANSVLRGQLLVFAHAGKIEIGKDCYIGEGTRIWSADSIKVGDRVLVAHNVNIHDTNSHSVDPILRHHHFVEMMSHGHPKVNDFDIQSAPICIEDDVWIGCNSTILKGVNIGKSSIVAAGSLVTKDVPEFVIVAGNPARKIRKV